MTTPELRDASLVLANRHLLEEVPPELVAEPDPLGVGLFLRADFGHSQSRFVLKIGRPLGFRRFAALYREEAFWMLPRAGERISELPAEIQFLMLELEGGDSALFVPLAYAPFRSSLERDGESLALVSETGDPHSPGSSALALFVALGRDPYELVSQAARSVASRLGTSRLRADKRLPDFADWFGWCTWDAFYFEVSHEKVREGLETFRKGGVVPRMMILDDGWQSERSMPTGEKRLTAFAANGKFPGDLKPTIVMAKEEFGLETFLVWHAFHGYWGGVDPAALPGYDVRETFRHYSPGILKCDAQVNNRSWGAAVGIVQPTAIHRFYHDYHRHLAAQGVDGVKVDNQASTEALSHGLGGRVSLMRSYREALEGSVDVHFDGRLINCMSCSNEMIYSTRASTLTRSSIDFWPNRPESHGLHLHTNALVGLWFGEFIHPDWDMFQSGHAMGRYHAAGRAVSGGPVYVSDKPGLQDFALLRKLVASDGSIFRARGIGRPTRDCLYRDPGLEDVLLKVFNHNLQSGVIGVFNARYRGENAPRGKVAGTVSPSDVPGLALGNAVTPDFAVYAHEAGTLVRAGYEQRLPVTLDDLTAEVFTIVPIDSGIAPIGLSDKFNSAGAIVAKGWQGKSYLVSLRDGGSFIAYCDRAPSAVMVNGTERRFSFVGGALRVELGAPGAQTVRIVLE
jgi:raffinose synthase